MMPHSTSPFGILFAFHKECGMCRFFLMHSERREGVDGVSGRDSVMHNRLARPPALVYHAKRR